MTQSHNRFIKLYIFYAIINHFVSERIPQPTTKAGGDVPKPTVILDVESVLEARVSGSALVEGEASGPLEFIGLLKYRLCSKGLW